jgi:hypothetical protein
MSVYKVEADYAPNQLGMRTEPGTNGVEYVVSDRELAEAIAESYTLPSDRHNGVEWIQTSDGTYELASYGSDSPLESIHARIDEIDVRDTMPEVWTADQRQEARREMNAADSQ